jgi:hypothetical protein
MEIDWSKAPEDATHFDARPHTIASFMRLKQGSGDEWMWWSHGGWQYYGQIGDTCSMTERPKPWNGEGLPPVGLEVEWNQGSNHDWVRVTVIAYFKHEAWISIKGASPITVGNPANFRPSRTPEQIAEEQREREFEEIRHVMGMFDDYRDAAEELLNRGYRKQETKPE